MAAIRSISRRAYFFRHASLVVVEADMSSAETPPDPDAPEPTEEEMRTAARNMLIAAVILILAAVFLLPR